VTTAIVAVIGTLLGAVTAGVMQHLTTVAARRDRDRQALATAVAALLGAATDHRRHQYLKHVMRRQRHEETMESWGGSGAACVTIRPETARVRDTYRRRRPVRSSGSPSTTARGSSRTT
jgi:hypothetical protein